MKKPAQSLAKNGVIGGLLGVIIAMAIVIIIYLTNDTIKVEEDVERYLGLSGSGKHSDIQRKKADPRNRNQENVADEIEYKELQICVNG